MRRAEELAAMEAALVETETARRLEEYVAARVAEVVASEAVQQSLKARLAGERKVRRASPSLPPAPVSLRDAFASSSLCDRSSVDPDQHGHCRAAQCA